MDQGITILIVDDFATMRRIIKGALNKLGFRNIFEAADGNEALKLLNKEKIGLVLCDWNMPNMTGIELLRVVRDKEKIKDVPFIIVTAESQKGYVLEAVKAGANHYIVKPFTPEILGEKIKMVLNK